MKAAEELERLDMDLRPARYTALGVAAKLGEMDAALVWIPVDALADLDARRVVARADYNLNAKDRPGNRYVTRTHVAKIQRGIIEGVRKLMVGTAILAIDPEYVVFRPLRTLTLNPPQTLVEVRILHGGAAWIVDFQHRDEALKGAVKELEGRIAQGEDGDVVARRELIRQSSVPVLVLQEADPKEITRMFVNMAQTKPIPPSLIAVMDQAQVSHEIAVEVAKKVDMLRGDPPDLEPAGAMEYLKNAAQGEKKLYPAAAWRTACSIILGGFRDRTPEQRESSVKKALNEQFNGKSDAAINRLVEIWDYAYGVMPGWRDIKAGKVSREKFRQQYIHGSSGGLYVFAGAVGAALGAGLKYQDVIGALAALPWERNATVKPRDPAKPKEKPQHPLFGELIRYAPVVNKDGEIQDWTLRSGGGNRSAYEQATRTLLQELAQRKQFEVLSKLQTLQFLGLVKATAEPDDDKTPQGKGKKVKGWVKG